MSDREDELDAASTSSLSLRYFSEDEGVELRRPSSGDLNPLPVVRSQSFQEPATFSGDQEEKSVSRFSVTPVKSEDLLPYVCQTQGFPPKRGLGSMPLTQPVKAHVVSRLIAKMRRATLDWRRLQRSRRGEPCM